MRFFEGKLVQLIFLATIAAVVYTTGPRIIERLTEIFENLPTRTSPTNVLD